LTRPTVEDVAWATDDLEELAHRHCPREDPKNETGFPDVVTLLNLLVWVDAEIRKAREAAAYGPGVKDGYRTLHRGGTSADLHARTNDLLLKQLRNLQRGYRHKLGNLVDEMRQDAETLVGREGRTGG